MSKVRYVGLDVHKDTIVIAVAEEGRTPPMVLGTFPHDVPQLIKRLAKLVDGRRELLRVCYEAGPTGYALHRRLVDAGIACDVVAPGLVPQQTGARVKTDRRDACRLAHFLRSGDLTPVWVPDEKTEAIRDLERLRDSARKAERVARQTLEKFLLRNERVYTGGRHWTLRHRTWLGQQRFSDPCRQCVIDDMLRTVDLASERLHRLTQEIERFVKGSALEPLIRLFCAFRGISTLSASIIAVEVGDFQRFATARQFMAFLGLVPSEHSSGQSQQRGRLTRTGNAHVRRILVEAAQHYRHRPIVGQALRDRQQGVPAEVLDISWKAQQRLCRRLRVLTERGKPRNKVIAALARELAGFLWSVGQLSPQLVA